MAPQGVLFLLWSLCALAAASDVQLKIVHVNDIHGRFDPQSTSFGPCTAPAACFGGMSRIATAVKAARQAAQASGSDFLLLHAGDQFTGTSWDYVYTRVGHHIAPQFLNDLAIDAFTIGNHEFDYGPAILSTFLGNLTAPILSCNLDVSKEPALAGKVQRYVVKTLPVSNVKVGIVGVTPQDTSATSSPGPTVKFSDPLAVLPGCVADAKAQGAQIIIALTHIGAELDLQLAALPAAKDIDIIIGGHSHTLFYGPSIPAGQPQAPGAPPAILVTPATAESNPPLGPYPININNNGKTIPVTSALWATRYLGVMDTTFSATGDLTKLTGAPLLLGGANSTNPVASDTDFAAMLDALRGPITDLSNQPVGSTSIYLLGPVALAGTPEASLANPARMVETNLGNLQNDAIIWYFKYRTNLLNGPEGKLPVVAISNGGGIRASIPVGNIKQGDIINVSPFGNWAVAKRVNAATLLAALNNGVSQWSTGSPAGRFPQVAGLKYAFNSSDDPANRLIAAWLSNGKQLGVDYTGDVVVLTNNYMGLAPGGDGYTMLANATLLLDTSYPLDRLLSEYIATHSPIVTRTDGRIVNCATSPNAPACAAPSGPVLRIALVGHNVSQSSNQDFTAKKGAFKNSGAAQLGIDGKQRTFILTQVSQSPTWQVDLGGTYVVEKVTLFIPLLPKGVTPPVVYRERNRIAFLVGDTQAGDDAQSCATLTGPLAKIRSVGASQAPPRNTVFCHAKGQYLTVQLLGQGQLSFAEIAVFGRKV